MIKLFSSDDRILIHHLYNLLLAEGLGSLIKNDMMFTLAGEIPATEIWPELWLIDSRDQQRAEQVINTAVAELKQPDKDWICQFCGEVHGAQFSDCWRCGHSRSNSTTE